MKKMIHVYKDYEDRIVNLEGSGEEVLDDFASLCGTLVNEISENTDIPEERIVSVLSMKMAQGISERHNARKEG